MATHQRVLLVAIAATLLTACGSNKQPEAAPAPPPVKETVFKDMAGTLDKARGVQDTVDAQKAAQDNAIRAEEEGSGSQ
ncbi:MAG TPA: hypothetical protein VGN07_04240 [Steroidobacteraceae bacterium]